ncbi:MAG: transketolase [Proteobacteria bacterium]|nr:transketolase [Pseudomonadota bacterium]
MSADGAAALAGTAPAPDLDLPALALRLRRHVVRMTSLGGSSHVGSALSMADIIAVLFGKVLRLRPEAPDWPGRDRFILSKGHAGACVYAALAERGFFPTAHLDRHYQNGSNLSGHVSHKGVPGVEFSTGSLGHGLGVGAGMALQLRRQGGGQRVFVVLSDGEMDEGSNWEAILFAAHHRLANLTAVVDYNKIQSLAPVAQTLALEPFAEKWRAFGWTVREADGHDTGALTQAIASPAEAGRPTCVIAHTTKGKGVSFMEDTVLWHYRSPQGEELAAALRELDAAQGAGHA